MDKRYQVFVSSTFTDLKEERKAIIEGLLNAKYIPAGMEMFAASNDEQFKYIKKIIDTCDYYVLIVGARYGSINPSTGKSFTEQEYDYAVEKGIPVLAFLHDDPYNLPVEKRDVENRKLLEQFRNKVSDGRLCKMWHTSSELISSVIISLGEEVANNPQMGWTRGKYPVKESNIDSGLLDRVKETIPTSRKAKLNRKLDYDANDDTKYIKAYLPDMYQIPSFELYLEIEIDKFSDVYWGYSVNLVRSGQIFKFPIRIGSGEVCVTEECVVDYVLSELENEEIDWGAEIQVYDKFVEYAMTYFDKVYDIKRV